MATRLIQMQDGTLVEVEALPNEPQQISSDEVKKVKKAIQNIDSVLVAVCKPVIASWKELNKEVDVETAEVELSLSFEGEGNIYITKAKAGANITVKLTLKYTE